MSKHSLNCFPGNVDDDGGDLPYSVDDGGDLLNSGDDDADLSGGGDDTLNEKSCSVQGGRGMSFTAYL